MSQSAEAIEQVSRLRGAGKLAEAEQLCRHVLAAEPNHAPALHELALIAFAVQNYAVAAQYASRAIAIGPRHIDMYLTLAEAYRALQRFQEAVATYQEALGVDPSFAAGHSNLATLLQAQGDLAGAETCYRAAIRVAPEYAEAHNNLGYLLQATGRWEESARHFTQALRFKPNYIEAALGIGNGLREQGKLSEAIDYLTAAARRYPTSALAQCALGIARQSQREFESALACYRRAIELQPQMPETYFNAGTALCELDRPGEAIECFTQSLRLGPHNPSALANLAGVYKQMMRPDEAAAAGRQAVRLAPNWPPAYGHLAGALELQGDLDGAIAAYRQAVELNPADAATHSNLLYALNFHPASDPQSLFAEHLKWARRHAEPLSGAAAPHPHERTSSPERRLRIGYFSPHFRQHAVSFFSEPLIAAHDHNQFEVFCYADVKQPDTVTERFIAAADHWRNVVGLSDDAVAAQIRADRVDILVDLTGHIGENRLLVFARKPAPIQVTYLGYQNTTGMSAMDYRLTDAFADPPGATDSHYSERLVRLPTSFFCFLPPDPCPDPGPLPCSLRGQITFASLNHIPKLTRQALDTWLQILARVNDSRLLVLAYTPGELEASVKQLAAAAGVAPQRIEFVNKRPRYEYLELHQEIDIALDTFPFQGHTTVCDALWMGVPSIMLAGGTYASRFGSSALETLALGNLVSHNPQAYVEAAVRLAMDKERLADLRATLRARMQQSPLLDGGGFARQVEAAYRQMWQTRCTPAG